MRSTKKLTIPDNMILHTDKRSNSRDKSPGNKTQDQTKIASGLGSKKQSPFNLDRCDMQKQVSMLENIVN